MFRNLFVLALLVGAPLFGALSKESLHELRERITRQQEELLNLKQELEWQTQRSAINKETAELDVEAAHLELEKLIHGDGPMEEARLRSALKGAEISYDSIKGYAADLEQLKGQGYFNDVEYSEAQDAMRQKKAAYETAQLQLDCYLNYVHPMRVRKAENQLRRCQLRLDEVVRAEEEKVVQAERKTHNCEEALMALCGGLPDEERILALLP